MSALPPILQPVISINTGYGIAEVLGLMHHVGQLEYNAGIKAGESLVASGMRYGVCVRSGDSASFSMFGERCSGFEFAISQSAGVSYIGHALVPDDSDATFVSIIERIISSSNTSFSADWTDIGLLLTAGNLQIDPALTLQQSRSSLILGSFDSSDTLDAAIDAGALQFAMDQQQYLQGYLPVLFLTLFAYTGLAGSNFAVESGPHLITSSISEEESICRDSDHLFAACAKQLGCPGGQYFGIDGCVDCQAGTFASGIGIQVSCDDCPAGTFASLDGLESCGACPNGQVALANRSTDCMNCPYGAKCDDTSSLIVKRGMWRPQGKPYSIYECQIPEACPGGVGYGEELCAEGFVGPLCAHCDSSYFLSWSGETCEKCDVANNHGPAVGVAVVVGLVIAGIVIFRNRKLFRSTSAFKFLWHMRKVGKVKIKTVFFALQVQKPCALHFFVESPHVSHHQPRDRNHTILGSLRVRANHGLYERQQAATRTRKFRRRGSWPG